MTYSWQVKNGDYVISQSTGRPVRIANRPKASQAMARLLGTEMPTGAGIDSLVGTVPNNVYEFSSAVQQRIQAAFDRLLSVQALRQSGNRTPFERLSYIGRMYVQPAQFKVGEVSKTGYVMKVDVVTAGGESVNLQRSLITPQGG